MHELPVTEGILQVVLDAARQAGNRRVTAIDLVIGDLSSFVDDSVQFYFDILSRETLAAGAVLRFQRVPGTVTCADCGQRFDAQLPLDPQCIACGSVHIHVTGGQQMRVASIEVA